MQPSLKIDQREDKIKSFLDQNNLAKAKRNKLSGDASFRNYERINDGKNNFILMNAPPPKEDIKPFIKVDEWLVENGFSAPKIIASNKKDGFILLEDFGDSLFSNLLDKRDSKLEKQLYLKAIDVLTKIRKFDVNIELPEYSDTLMQKEIDLFTEWYLPKIKVNISNSQLKNFNEIWKIILPKTRIEKQILVLRDYHASNLMWLSGRSGHKAVGLLDFQDAVIGHPAYDLVSLLEDARRDVSKELSDECFEYYLKSNPDISREEFKQVYDILGAQRNIKIIGIFSRLSKRDGKHGYLQMIPRVWKYLEKDILNPVLKPVKKWLDEVVTSETRKAVLRND